ncbi:hypothetical protein A2U01_0051868 [Trifolium medium]|uniref:Uncharacterized protein n=1 Tax=Trifolium medium TaxID=97028 RepID=A0A392R329_9FABA|nr:hypothetical protein [Trifolium medium]
MLTFDGTLFRHRVFKADTVAASKSSILMLLCRREYADLTEKKHATSSIWDLSAPVTAVHAWPRLLQELD